MSHPGLAKKLQPAKKALKRFARKVQAKFRDFNFSKAIEAIQTKTNTLITYCSFHFFHPFKKRTIARSKYHNPPYNHIYQYYSKSPAYNFSPIYIDQLYAADHHHKPAAASSTVAAKRPHVNAETSSKGKQVVHQEKRPVVRKEGNNNKGKEKILDSIEDAWKEVVAKSPQLRPVDERAEEFIHNFKKEIRLQKDRSAAEYQEMLARSA
ncbi:hypothetical protein Tsubulata_001214 [Turnera subulata]|uniref:DUF761 domain-containing protein n=1 Tax=Turnera subulata TaxID=218843 RepID=A0A9Q0F677_9ROSI|nr:hypothetical protein Tsubulata_001214 [Turnera subulata]